MLCYLINKKVSDLFDLAFDAFSKQRTENFEKISKLHQNIRDLIKSTRDEHVARLSSGMYPVEVSKSVYSVLFSLQRIADHIVNIAFSIRSTTGSKKEALQAIQSEKRESEAEELKVSL